MPFDPEQFRPKTTGGFNPDNYRPQYSEPIGPPEPIGNLRRRQEESRLSYYPGGEKFAEGGDLGAFDFLKKNIGGQIENLQRAIERTPHDPSVFKAPSEFSPAESTFVNQSGLKQFIDQLAFTSAKYASTPITFPYDIIKGGAEAEGIGGKTEFVKENIVGFAQMIADAPKQLQIMAARAIGLPPTPEALKQFGYENAERALAESPEGPGFALLMAKGGLRPLEGGKGVGIRRASREAISKDIKAGRFDPEAFRPEPIASRETLPKVEPVPAKKIAEISPKLKAPAPTLPKPEKVAPVAPLKAPVAVKKPPVVEKPAVKPTPEPLEAVALKKETITQIRKDFELDKLTKPERKGFEQSAKEAVETKAVENALLTSEEVIKSKRAVSDVEHAGMAIKATELMNEYDVVLADIGKQAEKGNAQGVKLGQKRADAVLSQIETITRASDFAGTEAGRTLSIRRAFINRNDFSVARLKIQAKATKGKSLDAKQNKAIEDFAVKNKALEKKVSDLEKKYAKDLDNEAAILAERIHQRELTKTKIAAKTKTAKKKIKSDIEGIKSQIRDLGIQVNEATGLGPEAAFLVGKLAVKYSNSGIQTLKGVVQKVLQDIPSIAERDVIQSMNAKDPLRQRKARPQAQKTTQLLKREARLITDLEAAEQGIFKTLPKKGEKAFGAQATTIRNIKDMQAKIRALKAGFNRTISDGKRLQRAFDTVAQLEDQLSGLLVEVKKRRAPDPIFIKALKEKAVELRKLLRTQDEIKNLNKQLETGDFVIREKQILKRQPQDLERAQVELNTLRKKVRRTIEDLAPLTPGKVTQEVINTLRTFKATADMSYLMRQGLFLSARRPGLAIKAAGKSIQATFSELKAEQIDNALRRSPQHYIRELAGIEFTEIGGKIRAGEEAFMSRVAEKIPIWGRVIKASERNMTTGLNMLRAGVFDEFITKFPNATLQEMKAYGNYINVATGRGNLGKFGNAGNILGSVFFAPRFAASRFQTPFALYKNLKLPRVRNEIAKDFAAVGGMGMTVLTLADLAGADVTFDFDSADFGKIKIGNTSIDMWAGFQQPLRLIMQAGATPFRAKIAWGQDPVDLLSRFSQYKLGPGITLPRQLITGKTIFGEKIGVSETLARSVTPIFLQSVIDAYKEGGRENAVALNALDLFGISVNTYNRATKRKK